MMSPETNISIRGNVGVSTLVLAGLSLFCNRWQGESWQETRQIRQQMLIDTWYGKFKRINVHWSCIYIYKKKVESSTKIIARRSLLRGVASALLANLGRSCRHRACGHGRVLTAGYPWKEAKACRARWRAVPVGPRPVIGGWHSPTTVGCSATWSVARTDRRRYC